MNAVARLPAVLLVLVAVVLLYGTADGNWIQNASAEEIKIGFLNDFEHISVFNYAVDAFNSEQRGLGSNYSITTQIVATNSDTVTSDLQRLHREGYSYFVGPLSSAVAGAALQYADTTHDIVMLSPSSTAASLAIPNDSLFRLVPDDDSQAPEIIDQLVDQGKEHIVIIYRNDAWGLGLLGTIEREYPGNVEITLSLDDPHASVAERAAATISELSSIHGASQVGVILISFDTDTVSLIQAITSDSALAGVLDDVKWYGTDGSAEQSELVDDATVAEFLSSVSFTATKFNVAPNPVNQILVQQNFADDSTYGNNVYDAVFLLADAVIANDKVKETDQFSTVRSIIPDVASGLVGHDYRNPYRSIGDGALGAYSLNAAGDLAAPLTYTKYVISMKYDGSFEWQALPGEGMQSIRCRH